MRLPAALIACSLVLPIVATVAPASAQAVLDGTRVIVRAADRDTGVRLRNPGQVATLTQVWIDDGNAMQTPEVSRAPFMVDRPVTRLAPGRSAVMRVRVVGRPPDDEVEQLYWLNLQDIPLPEARAAGDDKGRLQVAVRGRFKVLYRPRGLSAPVQAADQVAVAWEAGATPSLVLRNAAPFYFHLGHVYLLHAGGQTELRNPHVPPRGETRIELPAEVQGAPRAVRLVWIDDDGQMHEALKPM